MTIGVIIDKEERVVAYYHRLTSDRKQSAIHCDKPIWWLVTGEAWGLSGFWRPWGKFGGQISEDLRDRSSITPHHEADCRLLIGRGILVNMTYEVCAFPALGRVAASVGTRQTPSIQRITSILDMSHTPP